MWKTTSHLFQPFLATDGWLLAFRFLCRFCCWCKGWSSFLCNPLTDILLILDNMFACYLITNFEASKHLHVIDNHCCLFALVILYSKGLCLLINLRYCAFMLFNFLN